MTAVLFLHLIARDYSSLRHGPPTTSKSSWAYTRLATKLLLLRVFAIIGRCAAWYEILNLSSNLITPSTLNKKPKGNQREKWNLSMHKNSSTPPPVSAFPAWPLSASINCCCKVTGRRHRVFPCRSAYFASPWWLLTLDLRRRSRETALLFPESWWHLTMRLSPVSFLW